MPTLMPMVKVQLIGGENIDLNIPPNYIKSLTHERRSMGAGNQMTLELFDPSWGILDLFMQKAKSAVGGRLAMRVQYGWHDDLSQIYIMGIMKVNPGQLTFLGVEISLEGIDAGVVDEFSQETSKGFPNKVIPGRISDIVRKYAKKRGWSYDILETDPSPEYTGKKKGEKERKWVKGRKTTLEFIKYLSKFAKNSRHPGEYLVRLETTEVNKVRKTKLFFRPPSSKKLYQTYFFMHEEMGKVISFEPQIDSLGPTIAGLSGIRIKSRDKAKRKRTQAETNAKKHKNAVYLGNKALVPPGQVAEHIMATTSAKQLEDTLESYYAFLASLVFKAEMTLLGDVKIRPQDLVAVFVQTPQGVRYFTSGTWRVLQVTNEVTAGKFTTRLEMYRNSSDVGEVTPGGPRLQIFKARLIELDDESIELMKEVGGEKL